MFERTVIRMACAAAIALAAGGCSKTESLGEPQAAALGFAGPVPVASAPAVAPTGANFHASDQALAEGKAQFRAGAYGLAEKHFRQAVEVSPRDLEAWIGLAASYDRLRRFDLADRAYDQAVKLGGESVPVLNNRGYSHLLRGDLKTARRYFLKAHERDPGNPVVKNNIDLLNSSGRYIERLKA